MRTLFPCSFPFPRLCRCLLLPLTFLAVFCFKRCHVALGCIWFYTCSSGLTKLKGVFSVCFKVKDMPSAASLYSASIMETRKGTQQGVALRTPLFTEWALWLSLGFRTNPGPAISCPGILCNCLSSSQISPNNCLQMTWLVVSFLLFLPKQYGYAINYVCLSSSLGLKFLTIVFFLV